MLKWLRNFFAPKELENFKEKLKSKELSIVDGKIVCNSCSVACTLCRNDRRIVKLQKELDIIVSTL